MSQHHLMRRSVEDGFLFSANEVRELLGGAHDEDVASHEDVLREPSHYLVTLAQSLTTQNLILPEDETSAELGLAALRQIAMNVPNSDHK